VQEIELAPHHEQGLSVTVRCFVAGGDRFGVLPPGLDWQQVGGVVVGPVGAGGYGGPVRLVELGRGAPGLSIVFQPQCPPGSGAVRGALGAAGLPGDRAAGRCRARRVDAGRASDCPDRCGGCFGMAGARRT
jgi:hypothetical protein